MYVNLISFFKCTELHRKYVWQPDDGSHNPGSSIFTVNSLRHISIIFTVFISFKNNQSSGTECKCSSQASLLPACLLWFHKWEQFILSAYLHVGNSEPQILYFYNSQFHSLQGSRDLDMPPAQRKLLLNETSVRPRHEGRKSMPRLSCASESVPPFKTAKESKVKWS